MRHLILCVVLAGSLISGEVEGDHSELLCGSEPATEISTEQLDCPEGIATRPVSGSIDSGALADPNDPTSGDWTYVPPVERILSSPAVRDDHWASRFVYGGPDYPVYTNWSGNGDMDVDEDTGDIYVSYTVNYPNSTDTLYVLKSVNGGITWSTFGICTNIGGDLSIRAPVRVVKDADGQAWVIVLSMWYDGPEDIMLISRRWHTDGSGGTWEQLTDELDWVAGLSLDMDAGAGTGGIVHAAWIDDNSIWSARNSLDGNYWQDRQLLFYDYGEEGSWVQVAAGIDGMVAVAFTETRTEGGRQIRVKRSDDYGQTWYGSVNITSDTLPGLSYSFPSVALSRTDPQIGWVTFTLWNEYGSGFYYTENGGQNWTFGGYFDVIDPGFSYRTGIRASKFSDLAGLAFTAHPPRLGDNFVNFTYSSSTDPSSFITPYRISDYQADIYYKEPVPCFYDEDHSLVLYRKNLSYWYIDLTELQSEYRNDVEVDRTAVDIQSPVITGIYPNPFSSSTEIAFQLSEAAPVSISIYDASGRVVSTLASGTRYQEGSQSLLWNGTDASGAQVPAGVYICRITAGSSAETLRMVVTR